VVAGRVVHNLAVLRVWAPHHEVMNNIGSGIRTGAEELAAGSDQTAENTESAGSGDRRKI